MLTFFVFSISTALRKAQTVIPTDTTEADSNTNNGQSLIPFTCMAL